MAICSDCLTANEAGRLFCEKCRTALPMADTGPLTEGDDEFRGDFHRDLTATLAAADPHGAPVDLGDDPDEPIDFGGLDVFGTGGM